MDHTTERKLKSPDQFIATTEHGISWVSQNKSQAVTAAVIAVVAILAVVGVYTFDQHRSAKAATEFGAAMQTYESPVATPGQPVEPGTKTYATVAERAKAANDQFNAVAGKYGMTTPGKMSKYFAGLTYMEEGQNSSAEEALKATASSWNSNLSALGKLALAQLYQQTGRDSQAIDLYNTLAKGNATTVPQGSAKIALAELYESEGKTADAKKIYAELKDKDKDSKGDPGPAAQLATEKLNPTPAGPGAGGQ